MVIVSNYYLLDMRQAWSKARFTRMVPSVEMRMYIKFGNNDGQDNPYFITVCEGKRYNVSGGIYEPTKVLGALWRLVSTFIKLLFSQHESDCSAMFFFYFYTADGLGFY